MMEENKELAHLYGPPVLLNELNIRHLYRNELRHELRQIDLSALDLPSVPAHDYLYD